MKNKFPRGKLNATDEGELAMKIGIEKDCVVIDFGKPVVWIGMPPKDAAALANKLIKYAREAARKTGDIIEIQL